MIDTIKLPRNLHKICEILPKPTYNNKRSYSSNNIQKYEIPKDEKLIKLYK